MTKEIIALCIERNSSDTIACMIESLFWVDRLIVVDDHSDDNTLSVAMRTADAFGVKMDIIRSDLPYTMFDLDNDSRDTSKEIKIRNHYVHSVFRDYDPRAVVLIDSDEIMDHGLLDVILTIDTSVYDSVALECNHVIDKCLRLNIYQQKWNDTAMIDPHVRVLFSEKQYQPGEWAHSTDCFLSHDTKTFCTDGPFHYHLHYIPQLQKRNYSLGFLPRDIGKENAFQYMSYYKHPLPQSVENSLKKIIV